MAILLCDISFISRFNILKNCPALSLYIKPKRHAHGQSVEISRDDIIVASKPNLDW